MNINHQVHLITSSLLILTIGLVCGYPIGYFRAQRNHFPEIKFTKDINSNISTIKLMEIKNGKLIGEGVGASTRLAYDSENILTIHPGSSFEIPLNQIQLKHYYQAAEIPKNALFIASKSGQYYYSIFDKKAFNIASKNRLYFESEKEAKEAGYAKK